MKRIMIGLAVLLATACSTQAPEPEPNAEPTEESQPLGGPGFHEKDTSAIVERPVEHDASAKIRLVRGASGRRTPHYVAPGVDVVLSFAKYESRWIVSGAAKDIASQARTVICLTTTSTLAVATQPGQIETTCGVVDRGAKTFHGAMSAGTWTRGIGDDGRVTFTRDADPFKLVRYDELGKGCDSLVLQKGGLVFGGASFCNVQAQPGAICSDPCFKGTGKLDANGFCAMRPDAQPFCPADKVCTGDPDPSKRCK